MDWRTRRIVDNIWGPTGSLIIHVVVVLLLVKFMVFQERGGEREVEVIIKEVEERTGQNMQIETGALYHAIRRMREDGLIEPIDESERPKGEDTRRRTYRLTNWGREVLAAESARLRQLVEIAEAKQVLQARTT